MGCTLNQVFLLDVIFLRIFLQIYKPYKKPFFNQNESQLIDIAV